MKVCNRHKIEPAKIYGQCIGCEIEMLTAQKNGQFLIAEQYSQEIDRLTAEQDVNAPWLSLAHIICTDMGVPQGRIEWRLQVLQGLLAESV